MHTRHTAVRSAEPVGVSRAGVIETLVAAFAADDAEIIAMWRPVRARPGA